MRYTKLMSVLDTCHKNKTEIVIYCNDGFIIKSKENTGTFETDNCLDLDDENYLEYYACAVLVSEIIQEPNKPLNPELGTAEVGCYVELSIERNEPLRIESTDGTILWQRGTEQVPKRTKLMSVLDTCHKNKTEIVIYCNDGLIIKSKENTGVYEMDNGIDPISPNYLAYYACAVTVSEVIQEPNKPLNPELGFAEAGQYIRLSSERNEPMRIESTDGTILWQREEEHTQA